MMMEIIKQEFNIWIIWLNYMLGTVEIQNKGEKKYDGPKYLTKNLV